ncbi:MAG TPA: peptidylprolyl isomerase [Gammaproteobacteria bacterium]|nr:peptidylprolyl isomerase [Gammaproteobacteria bacterium]
MTKPALLILTSIALILSSGTALAVDVRICTSRGAIDVELDDRRAPLHAANFVRYAESGFYDGTILHRAVPGSMVQGGSYTLGLERRTPSDPVRNESGNGLSNQRGTIAASRADDPDSATSQFFFNLSDNTHLDARPGAPGYTVFGRVTAGLQVLDAVSAMPTRRSGNLDEVPQPLVVVESVTALDRQPRFGLSIEPDPAALRADLETMRSRGDAPGILGAIDTLRRSCIDLDAAERLAEAEAAESLGLNERSRYARERYMAAANGSGPALPRARDLIGGLPEAEPIRDIDSLIAHCRRPVAPSVPDGRFTELTTMQALEGAVLRYRQLGELYIDCVARVIENQELNDAETIEATKRHNDAVIEMTAVLMRFNQAARTFKAAR